MTVTDASDLEKRLARRMTVEEQGNKNIVLFQLGNLQKWVEKAPKIQEYVEKQ